MFALLPPSSITNRLSGAPAQISRAARAPPVNVTARTSGWETRERPSAAGPTRTLTESGGQPASIASSTSWTAVSGAAEAGFTMVALPPMIDGPSLWASRFRGALNGVIAATTPIGRRCENAQRGRPPGVVSVGICSPASRSAARADNRSVSAARTTSRRVSRIGLPVCHVIVAASRSESRSTRPARRSTIATRLWIGRAPATFAPATAVETAVATSTSPASRMGPSSAASNGARWIRSVPRSRNRPPRRERPMRLASLGPMVLCSSSEITMSRSWLARGCLREVAS